MSLIWRVWGSLFAGILPSEVRSHLAWSILRGSGILPLVRSTLCVFAYCAPDMCEAGSPTAVYGSLLAMADTSFEHQAAVVRFICTPALALPGKHLPYPVPGGDIHAEKVHAEWLAAYTRLMLIGTMLKLPVPATAPVMLELPSTYAANAAAAAAATGIAAVAGMTAGRGRGTACRKALPAATPMPAWSPLSLGEYDWVGFDVDHTLVPWDLHAVSAVVFDAAVRMLWNKNKNKRDAAPEIRAGVATEPLPPATIVTANVLPEPTTAPGGTMPAAAAPPPAAPSHSAVDVDSDPAHAPPGAPAAAPPTAPPPTSTSPTKPRTASMATSDRDSSSFGPDVPRETFVPVAAAVHAVIQEDANGQAVAPAWLLLCETGIVLDGATGCILWVDAHARIIRAVHGQRALGAEALAEMYPGDAHEPPCFSEARLCKAAAGSEPGVRLLTNDFDAPISPLFALLVHGADLAASKAGLPPPSGYMHLLTAAKDAVVHGFSRYTQGFSQALAEPVPYLRGPDANGVPEMLLSGESGSADGSAAGAAGDAPARLLHSAVVRSMLAGLRSAGRKLFVLSNAGWNHVDDAMAAVLGQSWTSLFDVVIVGARKRAFFQEFGPVSSRQSGSAGSSASPLPASRRSGTDPSRFVVLEKCTGRATRPLGPDVRAPLKDGPLLLQGGNVHALHRLLGFHELDDSASVESDAARSQVSLAQDTTNLPPAVRRTQSEGAAVPSIAAPATAATARPAAGHPAAAAAPNSGAAAVAASTGMEPQAADTGSDTSTEGEEDGSGTDSDAGSDIPFRRPDMPVLYIGDTVWSDVLGPPQWGWHTVYVNSRLQDCWHAARQHTQRTTQVPVPDLAAVPKSSDTTGITSADFRRELHLHENAAATMIEREASSLASLPALRVVLDAQCSPLLAGAPPRSITGAVISAEDAQAEQQTGRRGAVRLSMAKKWLPRRGQPLLSVTGMCDVVRSAQPPGWGAASSVAWALPLWHESLALAEPGCKAVVPSLHWLATAFGAAKQVRGTTESGWTKSRLSSARRSGTQAMAGFGMSSKAAAILGGEERREVVVLPQEPGHVLDLQAVAAALRWPGSIQAGLGLGVASAGGRRMSLLSRISGGLLDRAALAELPPSPFTFLANSAFTAHAVMQDSDDGEPSMSCCSSLSCCSSACVPVDAGAAAVLTRTDSMLRAAPEVMPELDTAAPSVGAVKEALNAAPRVPMLHPCTKPEPMVLDVGGHRGHAMEVLKTQGFWKWFAASEACVHEMH